MFKSNHILPTFPADKTDFKEKRLCFGRTLHWCFDQKTEKEVAADPDKEKLIFDIADIVNKITEWTCETFNISSFSYYPNWRHFPDDVTHKSAWGIINKRYDSLLKKSLHPLDAAKKLEKEKLIKFLEKGSLGGFCKVGGNEWNAFMVFVGLLKISEVLPKAVITLHDEGEFLKFPILIKNMRCKLDKEDLKESMNYWEKHKCLDEISKQKKSIKEFVEQTKDNTLKKWHSPSLFHRSVTKKDFEIYPEYSQKQIMAGFSGEYWKLTRKDPEKESLKVTTMIEKMCKKSGLDVKFGYGLTNR